MLFSFSYPSVSIRDSCFLFSFLYVLNVDFGFGISLLFFVMQLELKAQNTLVPSKWVGICVLIPENVAFTPFLACLRIICFGLNFRTVITCFRFVFLLNMF